MLDNALSPRLLSLTLCLGLAAPADAAIPESPAPIIIIDNNWSSQRVISRIASQLLESAGYATELLEMDTQSQFEAIGEGDAHLQMEIWEASMHASFTKQIDAGLMVDAGSHDATTREDWWYPDYVEEICPGLPDYKALNSCSARLATAETAPNARYLAGPAEWHPEDPERIKALGLNVTIVNADSIDSLFASLTAAVAERQPIVLFNWAPSWVGATYPGKFIEFPRRDAENRCASDPEWGVNPLMTNDCGGVVSSYLKKGLWAGFEDTYPCAYQLIANMNFSSSMLEKTAALVDVDGLSHDEAAARWLKNNDSVAAQWLPSCARR